MKYLIIIASICCFIGIMNLPPGYYTFLRILVSFVAAVIIYNEYPSRSVWFVIFTLILILFNPVFPVYLYVKLLWIFIDCITGLLLLYYFYSLIPKKQKIITQETMETPSEKTHPTRDRLIK